ncbi:MAG: Holliday junction branch migration protein RuvA [Spirochaetes bacterium]|nr:Holliday junction branch migration protein RuvA [Spirochaetota bacterium]
MFNSLSGEVTLREDERLCVATGGVEWELAVSRKASARFPGPGQPVRVYTHLLHREDAMKLYGFLDPAERSLFLDLQKVDGVGPRGAMRILSGIERPEFEQALDRDDVDALSAVPGIGKKTAQKIILTLKGKLTSSGGGTGRASEDDIATALVGMGFDRRTAKAAVAEALKSVDAGLSAEDLERELFRKAVAIAGKGVKP